MNYNKIIRTLLLSAFALGALSLHSCEEAFETPATGQDKYENYNKSFAYLKNGVSPNKSIVELFQDDETVYVSANITKPVHRAVTIKVDIDTDYVDAYNEANDTEYEAFPAELIAIEEDGTFIIPPGSYSSSYNIGLTLSNDASLVVGETYMLPVVIESVSDNGVSVKEENATYKFFVTPQGDKLSAAKAQDIKTVWCVETNDTNPLNAIELYLADQNKPLIDMVILFSANINYDNDEQRVFLHCNPSITAIIDGREKYIKPLQDRGIKVLLGILGNHDRAGVANLDDDTARYFANEMKLFCEAYDLDGVFFDDEWTDYKAPVIPGFVNGNDLTIGRVAAARLVYETKMAMPDKLVTLFQLNGMNNFNKVDGVIAGDFIDYVFPNYGSSGNPIGYSGITLKQMGCISSEYNQGMAMTTAESFKELYEEGWGAHMFFAMNPFPLSETSLSWDTQLIQMGNIAEGFYDDELIWTGTKHAKEW